MLSSFCKIRFTFLTRKRKTVKYDHRLENSLIRRRECIKNLGVIIELKLHFHGHVDLLFSHTIKLLGLICILTDINSIQSSYLFIFHAYSSGRGHAVA
jgi:hypothetical protein